MNKPIKMPYKHVCSICKRTFFSGFRGQNICSKECRKTIKRIKKYRKCVVTNCGWDATIEIHHEGGKEYDFCPNHHSLLTTGKQNIEEVLAGVVKQLIEIKSNPEISCPIKFKKEIEFDKMLSCPLIQNRSAFEVLVIERTRLTSGTEFLYQKLKENNLLTFRYSDVMGITNWKYEKIKRYVLILLKAGRVTSNKGVGGRGKKSQFTIV